MFIHRFQDTRKNQQELDILMRRLSRLQQVLPVIRDKRPVIMLSGTIHASKRLLMQQAFHAMLAGYPLHCSMLTSFMNPAILWRIVPK